MKANNKATVEIEWSNRTRKHDRLSLDLGKEIGLKPIAPLGPKTPPQALCDLLDLSICVTTIERRLRGRQKTNVPSKITLHWPVRDTSRWSEKVVTTAQSALGLMGNTLWTLKPILNSTVERPQAEHTAEASKTGPVVLFSGGLDSASGVASERKSDNFVLCGFYTQQKSVQEKIAEGLGMSAPIQWTWKNRLPRTRGRSYYYRSLLFLSMAAYTASSFDRKQIYQYENGILATAVHPAPSYRMTLHAHPHVHRLFESVLNALDGKGWEIKNPFLLLTKRQAVEAAIKRFGKEFSDLALLTQSCWAFQAPYLYKQNKKANRNCGVCTPCLIRRTALQSADEYSWDINKNEVRNDLRGEHFRNYFGFTERILSENSDGEFYRLLDGSSRDTLDANGYPDLKSLQGLFRKFAQEFQSTFPR